MPAGVSLPPGRASHHLHVHPSCCIPVHGLSAQAPGARLGEQGKVLPLYPYHPPACPGDPPLTGCLPAGHDKASSLEVTWPDGRVVARAVASSETNSVLEVPYPLDAEEPLVPALLEVRARCGCRAGGRKERLSSAGSVTTQG